MGLLSLRRGFLSFFATFHVVEKETARCLMQLPVIIEIFFTPERDWGELLNLDWTNSANLVASGN